MNQDEVLSLIDAIYGAATDTSGWPAVLQRVADAFGAAEASLSAVSTTSVPWLLAPRSDPTFLASYMAYYHPLNLFWQKTPVCRSARSQPTRWCCRATRCSPASSITIGRGRRAICR
jgi:hypothetical protein